MTDYILCGYGGKKDNAGIVFSKYIPLMLVETDEERNARIKKERAGKSFAKVKLSNGNSHYRHKRGQIVDKDEHYNRYRLEIETVNTCSPSGCYTLIGVLYPHGYEKIWFDKDELENFEAYDENGDKVDFYEYNHKIAKK